MSKYYDRLTVCDRDCAGANNCVEGGVQCPRCGMWYCPVNEDSDEEGNCADCAAEVAAEREAEEEEAYNEDA